MGKIRRKATGAARATKQAAAKAKSVVPKAGKSVTLKSGVTGVTLRRGPAKVTARKHAARKAASSQETPIQAAAAQVAAPTRVNGTLKASDSDVLRVVDAITRQRKELMDRLAR